MYITLCWELWAVMQLWVPSINSGILCCCQECIWRSSIFVRNAAISLALLLFHAVIQPYENRRINMCWTPLFTPTQLSNGYITGWIIFSLAHTFWKYIRGKDLKQYRQVPCSDSDPQISFDKSSLYMRRGSGEEWRICPISRQSIGEALTP